MSSNNTDIAIQKINQLFHECLQLHQSSYPDSPINFETLNLTTRLSQSLLIVGRGHFADVFQGELDDKIKVAVKILRLPTYSEQHDRLYESVLLRFFRELNLWSRLDHPNIARMLGFTLAYGNLGFVSLWYTNGNLVQYLDTQPQASKPDLILDVAEGLLYLHTAPLLLIHADLKGVNVFINRNGVACLGDFGISKQISDLGRRTGFTTSGLIAGTTPWMAPELLGEDIAFTFASDIYALAGIFLEIMCPGRSPFHYISNEMTVILAKLRGQLPDRQQYLEMRDEDLMWNLMTRCWDMDPTRRPAIREVMAILLKKFGLSRRVVGSVAARPPLLEPGLSTPPDIQDKTYPDAQSGLQHNSLRKHDPVIRLIDTGERFLQRLEFIDTDILQKLRGHQPVIPRDDSTDSFINGVFDGISPFQELERKLLQTLYIHQRKQREDFTIVGTAHPLGLGDILLKSAQEFLDVYPTYADWLPGAKKQLQAKLDHNSEFHSFLSGVGYPDSAAWDITTFIDLPLKYLSDHHELLAEILSETDPSDAEFDILKTASALIQKCQWSITITNLRSWQQAMGQNLQATKQWRDTVDQETAYQLSSQQILQQELIFEMVKKEMDYLTNIEDVTTTFLHPLETAQQEIVNPERPVIPVQNALRSLGDVFQNHNQMVTRLHEIQRTEYPVVSLRSVLGVLLDSVSNWASLYQEYLSSYPVAIYCFKNANIENSDFRHKCYDLYDESMSSEKIQNLLLDINFVELIMPLLSWYRDEFVSRLTLAIPPHRKEDHHFLSLIKACIDKQLFDLAPQVQRSSQRVWVTSFAAQLYAWPEEKEIDLLHEGREMIMSAQIWGKLDTMDFRGKWYQLYVVLLDNYLLLTRARVYPNTVIRYNCFKAIRLEKLDLGDWTADQIRIVSSDPIRYVEGRPVAVVEVDERGSTTYELLIPISEDWLQWKTTVEEAVALRRSSLDAFSNSTPKLTRVDVGVQTDLS